MTHLRWLGGKRRYVNQLTKYLPDTFTSYFEPFLGGGSFFFFLKANGYLDNCERVILSDTNYELIVSYICLQSDRFFDTMELLEEHKSKHDSKYFKKIKEKSYSTLEEIGARFLYFNRACFSGIYRENRYGEFNVSDKKSSPISWLDRNEYLISRHLLQGIELKCFDYSMLTEYAESGALVFCDPPYTQFYLDKNRTVYGSKEFDLRSQKQLKEFCDWCTDNGVRFMETNSSDDFTWNLYDGYQINTMPVKYNPSGTAKEIDNIDLIITNY
jgi:DNA adenine methylase